MHEVGSLTGRRSWLWLSFVGLWPRGTLATLPALPGAYYRTHDSLVIWRTELGENKHNPEILEEGPRLRSIVTTNLLAD